MNSEFESGVDLNGRDEAASLYVALLERQVLGLTLVNLRQKAALGPISDGAPNLAEDFDLEGAVDQAAQRIVSIQKESKRGFRRTQV